MTSHGWDSGGGPISAFAALRESAFDPICGRSALVRRLLDATAHPGSVVSVDGASLVVPPTRLRLACALLLAVLDRDLRFHVLGAEAADIWHYLRFNTGAQPSWIERANFVLVAGASAGEALGRLRRRALDAWRERLTIVYAPTSLAASDDAADVALAVTGPDAPGVRTLCLTGVAAEDFDALCETRLGVDVWLASADGFLAVIPRSIRWYRAMSAVTHLW
jgi:alpha-D-ribose 1-methylphosphonate 5-triphosphate synthase subunit PhnH